MLLNIYICIQKKKIINNKILIFKNILIVYLKLDSNKFMPHLYVRTSD